MRARKVTKLLPPGSVVCEYVRGRGHPRMTTGAAIAIALVVLVFIAGLAAGRLIYPGAFLLIWVVSEIRPYRAVVVTTLGVVLLNYSIITGRSKVLAYLPFEAALQPVSPSRRPKLQLGPDLLTLPRHEHQLLFAAATRAHAQLLQATAHNAPPSYNTAPSYNTTPNYFG